LLNYCAFLALHLPKYSGATLTLAHLGVAATDCWQFSRTTD
jgi:hypothetical protein